MHIQKYLRLALALATTSLALVVLAPDLHAQSYGSGVGYGNASSMWGTGNGGSGPAFVDSANSHGLLGYSASQVAAAQAGSLSATNVTIMTIGSQNIVQVTGDNNIVDSKQKASATGNISTNSNIGLGQ